MAKRKDLKSNINDVCTEMIAEVVATSLYDTHPNHENVLAIISSILKLRSDYIKRVSHVEPGLGARKYFKDVHESFAKEVTEICDTINNMHP